MYSRRALQEPQCEGKASRSRSPLAPACLEVSPPGLGQDYLWNNIGATAQNTAENCWKLLPT
eukprot:5333767-Alexandrium_andersonii.AAC.1